MQQTALRVSPERTGEAGNNPEPEELEAAMVAGGGYRGMEHIEKILRRMDCGRNSSSGMGKLISKEQDPRLLVESGRWMLLLDHLPWNISLINYHGCRKMLRVEWR